MKVLLRFLGEIIQMNKKLKIINKIIEHPEKLEELKRNVSILYNLGISKDTLNRWIKKYYKI